MAPEQEHSAVEEARLTLTNLRQQARPGVLLPPIILLVAVFVIAYLLRPSATTAAAREDYETFFEAAATVLGTILIAVVLQANLFRGPSMRRMLIYGLLYIALAEAASLIALLPGGSEHFQGVLFGLTISAGVGALLAVVYIGVRLLEEPGPELEMQPDGSALIEETPATPPTTAPAAPADRLEVPSGDREAERARRRERQGRPRSGRPSPRPFVLLHPEAVADLQQLGARESALVVRITERMISDARLRQKRAVRVDGDWYELKAGSLRIVFRPLSAEEASAHGQERGTLVRRVLAGQALRRWLSAAADHNPQIDQWRADLTSDPRRAGGEADDPRSS